jgi:hypothetical protein
VDSNGDGLLESWRYSTRSQRQDPSQKLGFLTPSGFDIFKYSGNIYIKFEQVGSSGGKFYKYVGGELASGNNADSNPQNNCQSSETCNKKNIYGGEFNFCPTNDRR